MEDTEYKRLMRAAKDSALAGFLIAMQEAILETDRSVGEMMRFAKSSVEKTAFSAVRQFLREEGDIFLGRIDALFRAKLDRAMETMYVDLRPGISKKLSADELSLVDDEAVMHQIEVGRLAQRIRDANEESIARLNAIIAMMHGQSGAKERENPFRPYLLARSLYEAIKETVGSDAKARVMFEHLANALALHLHNYYGAINDVFESSGMTGKLQTQSSRPASPPRPLSAPEVNPHLESNTIIDGLQRAIATSPFLTGGTGQPNAGSRTAAKEGEPATVDEFIRKMFAPSKSIVYELTGEVPNTRLRMAPLNPLVAQLSHYQNKVANREPLLDAPVSKENALHALRGQMDLGLASRTERMTIDVVSMLFEFILKDEFMPVELRRHIARLQVPVLKAALIEPEMMHEEDHPARQLINRMSTAAVGADLASPFGKALSREIECTVDKVLAEFDTDTEVFKAHLQEFEQFLSDIFRNGDGQTARGIESIEDAERFSVLLAGTTKVLREILEPLNVDKRIFSVMISVWPHVLVHAAWEDKKAGVSQELPHSMYREFHAVLPKLLWSVQAKSPQDRPALIHLLPDLIKRLRKAFDVIRFPEDEAQQVFDLLVGMHTRVLRSQPKPRSSAPPSLEDLREEFSRLNVNWELDAWTLPEPPVAQRDVIERVFALYGAKAVIDVGENAAPLSADDREFLQKTYLLGSRVNFRTVDGTRISGQLVWISAHRSLYLFRQDLESALVVYTPEALLAALRGQAIVPAEGAPVFELAVASLMSGAGALQSPQFPA